MTPDQLNDAMFAVDLVIGGIVIGICLMFYGWLAVDGSGDAMRTWWRQMRREMQWWWL